MIKSLKIIGWGLLVWSMGLLWPEVDLTLILAILAVTLVGVGLVILALLWWQYFGESSHTHTGQPQHPSRPVPIT